MMESIQLASLATSTATKKKSGPKKARRCRTCGNPMLGHKKKQCQPHQEN
jgi:hypothetical protein